MLDDALVYPDDELYKDRYWNNGAKAREQFVKDAGNRACRALEGPTQARLHRVLQRGEDELRERLGGRLEDGMELH